MPALLPGRVSPRYHLASATDSRRSRRALSGAPGTASSAKRLDRASPGRQDASLPCRRSQQVRQLAVGIGNRIPSRSSTLDTLSPAPGPNCNRPYALLRHVHAYETRYPDMDCPADTLRCECPDWSRTCYYVGCNAITCSPVCTCDRHQDMTSRDAGVEPATSPPSRHFHSPIIRISPWHVTSTPFRCAELGNTT
jgi:hypothetical protein